MRVSRFKQWLTSTRTILGSLRDVRKEAKDDPEKLVWDENTPSSCFVTP